MSDLNTVREDVEVGIEAVTQDINVRVTMMSDIGDSFKFTVSIDNVGQILLTPVDTSTEFIDASTEAAMDKETSTVRQDSIKFIEGSRNVGEFTVNLTATILANSTDPKIEADVDNIGQCVIYPVSESDMFISAALAESLNLITEDQENTDEQQEEVPVVFAEVITESVSKQIAEFTDNFTEEFGKLSCDTLEESTLCEQILSTTHNTIVEEVNNKYIVSYSRR